MNDPPELMGLNEQARACRLALAVFEDNRGRYDAALAEASTTTAELIWTLVSNWVRELVVQRGPEAAHVWLEHQLVGITEHWEEQLALGTYNPKGRGTDDN